MALLFLRKAFIARPDVATETVQRRATAEQAKAVYERKREELSVKGVKEVRVEADALTSFILIVVESEADVRRLSEKWGREVDGVPLRFTVP
jgi:hypothetical protein